MLFYAIFLVTRGSSQLQNHVISKTSHEALSINPVDELIVDIRTSPLILYLPRVSGFSADLYKQVQTAHIFLGTIAPGSPACAVYFRSGGRLIVSSTAPAVFEYFAVRPSRPCPIFEVTTAKSIDFFAAGTSKSADLTIKNNQKYCVFHLSDASEPTSVSVNFSTEDSFDILYFSDGEAEQPLSGDGFFHSHSYQFSLFAWISDQTNVSRSFAIRLRAPHSKLPPVRLNYTAESWPEDRADPLILLCPRGRSNASPTKAQYANADAEVWKRSGEPSPGGVAVMGIAACAGACLAIGAAAWICRCQFGRGSDNAQTEMLKHEIVGGVVENSLWSDDGSPTDRLQIEQSEGDV
jgi:hypothetical protein